VRNVVVDAPGFGKKNRRREERKGFHVVPEVPTDATCDWS
jgi:hypothetical protein